MIALEDLTHIALRAGDIIRQRYADQNSHTARKPDGSPVTDADLAADHLICADLRTLDPSIPILSEEGEIPGYSVRKNWRRFWLVDPLDGTKAFLNRTDEFTVNIALIQCCEPVLSVILRATPEGSLLRASGQGHVEATGRRFARATVLPLPRP